MADIRKIKKTAGILFGVVILVLLWFVGKNLYQVLAHDIPWTLPIIVLTLIGAAIILAALTLALAVLRAVQKEDTPFLMKNVKGLKAMAALLTIFEPYLLFQQWIFNQQLARMMQETIGGSTEILSAEVHSSLGGIVFVTGLLIYCVSLVLAYGVALQTQVDGTL